MQQDERYGRSLIRLLHELYWLISKRNAYNKLFEIAPETNWSFFSYASVALKNDMVSHAIKVLDNSRETSSFWYIHRSKEKLVEAELLKANLSACEIKNLSDKLRTVRDKTHFHIDKSRVFSPVAVWQEADISSSDFSKIFEGLWLALNELYRKHFGESFSHFIYSGEDVEGIVSAARRSGIDV